MPKTIVEIDVSPDEQWHWEQGNKYAHEGIKVLLALNGGAAVALLTFAGHAGSPIAIARVGYSLLAFGTGALFAGMVFLTSYLTQLHYGNNNRSVAVFFHNLSYVVVVLSIVAFLVGLGFAYTSLPNSLGSKDVPSQTSDYPSRIMAASYECCLRGRILR
jgi:hypothetical protein